MEVEKHLEVLNGDIADVYTTDIMYQLIGVDTPEVKIGIIQFYGDISKEIPYNKLLKMESVLKRTYLLVGPLVKCTDPISAGATDLWSILSDRNSQKFFWLTSSWKVISERHVLLKDKDILHLSFVVTGVEKARPSPIVPYIESIDPVYARVKCPIDWTISVKGREVFRYFPSEKAINKVVTARKSKDNNSSSIIRHGNWIFRLDRWKRIVVSIYDAFPEVKFPTMVDFSVSENSTIGSITATSNGERFSSPFNLDDSPARVYARAWFGIHQLLFGYSLSPLDGRVSVPYVKLNTDSSPPPHKSDEE